MSEYPAVSIIVPCFNSGKFIEETIVSLRNQSLKDWECLIIDDGSTDNSKEVIFEYLRIDKRIKYLYQENRGLSATRNKGISLSKGKFIQFLDSDDVILEEKLESQVRFLEENPTFSVVYSNYHFAQQDDLTNQYNLDHLICNKPIITFDDVLLYWEYKLSIPIHCCLFKSEAVKPIKFQESLPSHEDWKFHLEMTRTNNYHYLHRYTALYRVTTNSMSKDLTKMKKGTFMVINQLLVDRKKYWLVVSRYSFEFMQSLIDISKGKKFSLQIVTNTPFSGINFLESSLVFLMSFMLLPFSFIRKVAYRYL